MIEFTCMLRSPSLIDLNNLIGNQSTMDRFLKMKLTPTNDNDGGTSGDVREHIDGGTSRRDADTTNANNTAQRSSRI